MDGFQRELLRKKKSQIEEMFYNLKKSLLVKYPLTKPHWSWNESFTEFIPNTPTIHIHDMMLEYDMLQFNKIWKEINDFIVLRYDEYVVFDKCGMYFNYAPKQKIETRMIVCCVTNYSNLYWFDAFLCKSLDSNAQPGFKCMRRICYDIPLNNILIDVLTQTIDINTHIHTINNILHYECMSHRGKLTRYIKKIFHSIICILDINKKYV